MNETGVSTAQAAVRSPAPVRGPLSDFVGGLRLIGRNRLALLGGMLIALIAFTAIFAPFLATHDPYEINIAGRLQGPSAAHWLGTDFLGRDTYSRVVFGARTALQVAIGAVLLGAILGIPIGAIAGYAGRWVDAAIMRVMDAILAFPGRLIAIALVASLGGGLFPMFIAIGFNSIPGYARITRGSVLSQKGREYVEAARMSGRSEGHILFFQILPNCIGSLLVNLSLDFSGAILTESGLSFLGLGFPPPTASWGLMLKEVTPFLQIQPWAAFFPGLTISLVVLAFNLFGDGLRDVFDPRQYDR